MSIAELKKRRDIEWVDESYTSLFGPPVYDEKTSSYKFKLFKKGFTWGTHYHSHDFI
jgi:hypothetical protein